VLTDSRHKAKVNRAYARVHWVYWCKLQEVSDTGFDVSDEKIW